VFPIGNRRLNPNEKLMFVGLFLWSLDLLFNFPDRHTILKC
jgi:hypothetical protein